MFGQRKNETLIAGDMFKLEWVKEIDNSLPTLLIVSGVFQYFHEEEIIAFIKGVWKKHFQKVRCYLTLQVRVD